MSEAVVLSLSLSILLMIRFAIASLTHRRRRRCFFVLYRKTLILRVKEEFDETLVGAVMPTDRRRRENTATTSRQRRETTVPVDRYKLKLE
jgi:hypothetical protein